MTIHDQVGRILDPRLGDGFWENGWHLREVLPADMEPLTKSTLEAVHHVPPFADEALAVTQ